ncbi:MAG: hypothetical protein ABFS34_05085 [Gemmatimonadota bacterium]
MNETQQAAGILAAWVFLGSGCAPSVDAPPAVDRAADEATLLQMHQAVIQAHLDGSVDDWMALEEDPYVSANAGEVSFADAAERRARREPYLMSASFTQYEDLRPPVVRISDDGSLGWLIAEVQVRGVSTATDGAETPIEMIAAWIELYEKRAGEWKIVGNVSNRRP